MSQEVPPVPSYGALSVAPSLRQYPDASVIARRAPSKVCHPLRMHTCLHDCKACGDTAGRVQHQSQQSAQRPVLGAPPFNPGPASTPAANWASASVWNPETAQAGAALEQKTPPQHAQAGLLQQKDGCQHGTSHAPSWDAASARHIPADKGNSSSLPTSPGQRGGAGGHEGLGSTDYSCLLFHGIWTADASGRRV